MADHEAQSIERIEMIMQYAHLIIDNHVELRNIMLAILSKLTNIHTHDFGVKCFNLLKDLMVAEPELKELVRQHINTNVIQKLNKLPPKDIPVGLLNGLVELMEDPQLEGETALTTPLFRDFFPKWLSEIKESIIFKSHSANSRDRQREAQIDAILSLLTASLHDNDENIKQIIRQKLHIEVSAIFMKTQSNKSRYLPLLKCMTQIAKHNPTAASNFIDENAHQELIQDCKLTKYQYMKHAKFVIEIEGADTKTLLEEEKKQY